MSGVTYLREAADYIADELEVSLASPVRVYRVTDPGYAQLVTPCVVVDAPTIEEWSAAVRGHPIAVVSVPVRVLPSSTAAGGEALALADEVLDALHYHSAARLSSCLPTIASGQGLASPLPAYALTYQVTARTDNGG